MGPHEQPAWPAPQPYGAAPGTVPQPPPAAQLPPAAVPPPRAPADQQGTPWGGPAGWPPGAHPSGPLPVVPPSTGPIVVAWQPPARGRGGLIALLVVVLLLAAGGAGWFVWQGMTGDTATTAEKGGAGKLDELPGGAATPGAPDEPAGDDGATPDPADEGSTAPSKESAPPSVEAETAALVELDGLRNASLAGLTLDGRWVAQVASKYVGIADPLQEAPNGGHTFYAADILAEHLAVQDRVSGSADVLLLAGTDFGRRSTGPDGQQFWITLVDGGFGAESDVDAWCAATYPELTPEQRENACAPRTLSPPRD